MRKERVKKVLNQLGLKINVRGYRYLVDAVLLKNRYPGISTMEIYETVAEQNNTSTRAVERAIRHAICNLHDKCRKYFEINCKLTNTVIIQAIEEKARRVKI